MHHTPLVQQLRDISFAKTLSGLHQCRQYKARGAACHAVTILAWPIWLKDEITEYMQSVVSLCMARLLPKFKSLQLKPDLKKCGVAGALQFAAQKTGPTPYF